MFSHSFILTKFNYMVQHFTTYTQTITLYISLKPDATNLQKCFIQRLLTYDLIVYRFVAITIISFFFPIVVVCFYSHPKETIDNN